MVGALRRLEAGSGRCEEFDGAAERLTFGFSAWRGTPEKAEGFREGGFAPFRGRRRDRMSRWNKGITFLTWPSTIELAVSTHVTGGRHRDEHWREHADSRFQQTPGGQLSRRCPSLPPMPLDGFPDGQCLKLPPSLATSGIGPASHHRRPCLAVRRLPSRCQAELHGPLPPCATVLFLPIVATYARPEPVTPRARVQNFFQRRSSKRTTAPPDTAATASTDTSISSNHCLPSSDMLSPGQVRSSHPAQSSSSTTRPTQ